MTIARRITTLVIVVALLATTFNLFTTGTIRAAGAIEDYGANIDTGATTSLNVTLSGTPSDGELLVAFVGSMSTIATIGYPSGWSAEWLNNGGRGSCGVGIKVASSEASNVYTFTSDDSEEMVAGMYVVSGISSSTETWDLVSSHQADDITFDLGTVSGEGIALAATCNFANGNSFSGSWATGGTATSAATSDQPADQTSGSGTDVTASYGWVDVTAAGTLTVTSKSKSCGLSNCIAGAGLFFLDSGGPTPTPTPTPAPAQRQSPQQWFISRRSAA